MLYDFGAALVGCIYPFLSIDLNYMYFMVIVLLIHVVLMTDIEFLQLTPQESLVLFQTEDHTPGRLDEQKRIIDSGNRVERIRGVLI